MTRTNHDSPQHRALLLAGQALALGLTTAWVMIPASAIFLEAYGPELLPVTYIGAAIAGALSSVLLSASFRRHPVVAVASRLLTGLSITLVISWLLLTISGGSWVSFGLLVLVPILVPVGFVFVVGEAGILLDVRGLKALYARVVAGFALGFVAGGLTGPLLLALLAHTEDLLLAAATAAGLFLALVLSARRRYPELAVVASDESSADTGRPTVRVLTRHRYVMLIVAFQMLSAVESQWLDFLVFDRAAQRYHDSTELAQFISRFSAIAYGTDILFLLLVAGLLLRRFGLRYGLTANAAGVLIVLVAIVIAGSFVGAGATLVFVLIVAARVTDLTLSDGSSRTSLSAAYQAVPDRLRAVSQAFVEGLGVPVAIGASGVGLLVIQALGGTRGLTLPVLTALVVVAWIVVAILLAREYRVSLLANLRGRTLEPTALTIGDESSLVVIDRLVGSDDERDVRLGLDILTVAQHPQLPVRLQRLVTDDRVSVRTDALERLVLLAPHMAAAAAREGLGDSSVTVRAACLRVLGAAAEPPDLALVMRQAVDDAAEIKVAVAFALTRMGDEPARDIVGQEVARLSRSAAAADRRLAGAMVGAFAPGSELDRSRLRVLLHDADPTVVGAALAALRLPDDHELIPAVVGHLGDRQTSGAAVDALVRFGPPALTAVAAGLGHDGHGRHERECLVRAARRIGGDAAIDVLRQYVDHPDREVGLAVMNALAALVRRPGINPVDTTPRTDLESVESAIVRQDVEHATRALRTLVAFADVPHAALQNSAVRDELALVRARVLAALSMRHGVEGMQRVVFQFAQRDSRSRALALEWLDLELQGTERAVVALLEPGLSDRDRLTALSRWCPLPTLDRRELILDLVRDDGDHWRRPFIRACALQTAGGESLDDLRLALAAATESEGDDVAIVRDTIAGMRRRHFGSQVDPRAVVEPA